MALVKKCRHGRGLAGAERRRRWRRCGCRWLADVSIDGRRRYVALGADESAARRAYAQLVADLAAGRARPGLAGAATVGQAIDAWLARAEAAGRRPNTLDNYAGMAEVMRDWWHEGRYPLGRVRVAEVARFEDAVYARFSPGQARNLTGAFRGVLHLAERTGAIERAPVPRGRREIRPPERRRLTLQECEALVAAMTGPARDMAEVALLTGLRLGELVGLEAADVDPARQMLRVARQRSKDRPGPPKTRTSARVVALTPRTMQIIAPYLARGQRGPLFGLSYSAARAAMQRALVRTGTERVHSAWHALRHANTALRDAAGQGIRGSAGSLGHGAHFAQTMSYGWAAEREAAPPLDEARHVLGRHPST